ncbi:hypothetical protein K2173_025593 [Erythroxylum novogranatense]|uniref:RanBP2-type domain-containing protein n=1 Tax=Erythroxylum novogranatense TaxID=1862640 RepID=A0AAV8TAL2_9ROSI|nr:hypothetical protein K2173_025593 [Erythroxylum novogranatense]
MHFHPSKAHKMGGATTRFLLLLTASSPLGRAHCSPSLLHFSRSHRHPLPRSFHSLSLLPSSLCPALSHPHRAANNQQLHTLTSSTPQHHWPEWSSFVNSLSASGYFRNFNGSDEFVGVSELPQDFLRAVSACLAFALDRPDMLGRLSMRDIEVVVASGTPFLFKNCGDSLRRMRLFLGGAYTNVSDSDRAQTVDLMRFILSYASTFFSSENSPQNRDTVDSSIRNLLRELVQLSYNAPNSSLPRSLQNQFPDRFAHTPRSFRGNMEMKRGDWICPRCNFMNFARNFKCLECEEERPKRQLTGAEWECPQCDFHNYGRNMVCLRCDCKRPGERLFKFNSPGLAHEESNAKNAELDARLAANEEKAQRWFSKISQMDSNSDMSNTIADEDFPEIMPLRKGVNRFVVSTRKTPLQRRLANAQYERNLDSNNTIEGKNHQSMRSGSSQTIGEIFGNKSDASEDYKTFNSGQDCRISKPSSTSNSPSLQHPASKGGNSSYVPLPANMFVRKPEKSTVDESGKVDTGIREYLASSTEQQGITITGSNRCGKTVESHKPSENPLGLPLENEHEKEQGEKSDRWFKRVAELHNVTDLAGAISDDDFPEIMPMRKGENRFVVSKKKDRSLTSPMYKRQMAMEQTKDTNYVPFVPFPPNYFGKKDHQQSDANTVNNAIGEVPISTPDEPSKKFNAARPGVLNTDNVQGFTNQQQSTESWSSKLNGEHFNEREVDVPYKTQSSEISAQNVLDPQPGSRYSWSSGCSSNDNMSTAVSVTGNPPQSVTSSRTNEDGYPWKENVSATTDLEVSTSRSPGNWNSRESWNGRSLEGSAVKEPDPLDMSEEAKAERWFRRVAQIKDISELSQIPDEDFPSIMPMRKGVNRFVVSKRKTPLERRLTSAQYRKNLPVVSSDPVKESDSN